MVADALLAYRSDVWLSVDRRFALGNLVIGAAALVGVARSHPKPRELSLVERYLTSRFPARAGPRYRR